MFLGQFYRCGNISLWGRIAPSMKGIGIASLCIVTAITLFYTTIIGKKISFLFHKLYWFCLAHALFYLFSSFREVMPWSLCSHSWNTPFCSERMRADNIQNKTINETHFSDIQHLLSSNQTLQINITGPTRISSADEYYHIYMLGMNHSKGLTDLGSIKIDLLLCLVSIFILMYMCIYRGVKSTGMIVEIQAKMLFRRLILFRQSCLCHRYITLCCLNHFTYSGPTIKRFTLWNKVFSSA